MSRTWLASGSQHRASTQAAMSSTLVPHSGCYQSRSKVQAWPWNNLDFQHGRLSLSPHSLSSRADLSLPPLTLSPRHQQVAIPSQSPMSLRKAKPPRGILSCKASGSKAPQALYYAVDPHCPWRAAQFWLILQTDHRFPANLGSPAGCKVPHRAVAGEMPATHPLWIGPSETTVLNPSSGVTELPQSSGKTGQARALLRT